MESISKIISIKSEEKKTKKPAPHEIGETSNLIEEAGLFTAKYNRVYWMGKVKRAGIGFNEMIGILKEINNMDPKYNKGGRLTNLLTARAKKIKK
jgi:hypothetical protein